MKSDENLSTLVLHVYACILNESTGATVNNSSSFASFSNLSLSNNQNENLARTITPQIIDLLFKLFYGNDNIDPNVKNDIIYIDTLTNLDNESENNSTQLRKLLFYDRKLILCKCLPLVVNILHSSLPDKRQVELSLVLEKCILAFELVKRVDIKFEFVRSYLKMLQECADRAALKIVIVSGRFFTCLLEQINLVSQVSAENNALPFLHEFVRLTLCLIKNLLENSESVKVRH